MKPIKKSVAFVIYGKDSSTVLAVKRSSDDDSLPDVWGLPAGSLKDNESYKAAVVRSGREKLGVDLKVASLISEGEIDRGTYQLHMREYKAKIIKGRPAVPQSDQSVSQYVDWKWSKPDILKEAAGKGSLCSRLYLSSVKVSWHPEP